MATALNREELLHLAQALTQPSALTELAVLGACLFTAWAVVRLLRGRVRRPQGSIWFGRFILDGVLFPVLALLLALVARRAFLDEIPRRCSGWRFRC